MKSICQLYMPAFYRSYGNSAVKEATRILRNLKESGFSGVYLISLWEDGGYDNGFDIVYYAVNPKFGHDEDLDDLIEEAHRLEMEVGVDIVPHHVSDRNLLAQNCLDEVLGYEECLYVVPKRVAERLTDNGVPSFFGDKPYSDYGQKCVRSTFVNYHQLDLNWRSEMVQDYFRRIFQTFKTMGIDFVRVDCGMMLLENVQQAKRGNPFACMNPKRSVQAIRKVSGGMKMFFEWFDPTNVDLFNDMPECYALDCSYVVTGNQNTTWDHKKLIPLLGGHDQMTAMDRGIHINEALAEMEKSEYGFLDIQTLIGWQTDPKIQKEDSAYDADIRNPNQRYRARRPIEPILKKFLKLYP